MVISCFCSGIRLALLYFNVFGDVAAQGKAGAPQLDDENAFSFPVQYRDRRLIGHAQRFQPSFQLEGQVDLLDDVRPADLRVFQIHFHTSVRRKLFAANFRLRYITTKALFRQWAAFQGGTRPAGRQKRPPKACAFEGPCRMELLSRFELETSSLPRMRLTN